MIVIPAKAGIQCFQDLLDAPVSSTGQAPQVRHDRLVDFTDRLYLKLCLNEWRNNGAITKLFYHKYSYCFMLVSICQGKKPYLSLVLLSYHLLFLLTI